MVAINYLAVLLAAIAFFFVNGIFQAPAIMNLWMKLTKTKPEPQKKLKNMGRRMLQNFIVLLVFAYGLTVVYTIAATSTLSKGPGVATGICMAILVWFTFIISASSINCIWGGKSWRMWAYEELSSLVACIAMGAIIGAF